VQAAMILAWEASQKANQGKNQKAKSTNKRKLTR
jgi:hypothetical protein